MAALWQLQHGVIERSTPHYVCLSHCACGRTAGSSAVACGDAPRCCWGKRAAHWSAFVLHCEPRSARWRAQARGRRVCGRDEPRPAKTVFGCTAATHVLRSLFLRTFIHERA